MPIEYMFCFIYREQCINIISSRKNVWLVLVLYSRKIFLITLPLLFKKWVGNLTAHILSMILH